MLPDVIKSTPLNGIHIKEVTTISTICDVFNEQPRMKKLLSEIHTLLKIYLTIKKNKNLPSEFNDTRTS